MTLVKIQAGATFETTSPKEVEQLTKTVLSDHFQEMARGTKPMRFSASGTVSGGAVTIPKPQGGQIQMGPSPGFVWLVERITAFGLATASPSIANNGQQTGPTAGQTITSVSLGAGTWNVAWTVGLGGTTSGTETNNFELVNGTNVVLGSVNSSTSGQNFVQPAVTLTVPAGGGTVAIEAIANGTGTAIYRGQLVATPAQADSLQVHRSTTDGSEYLGLITASPGYLHIGGRGMLLYGGESLLVTGTSLQATGQILVNGEGIEVPAFALWKIVG